MDLILIEVSHLLIAFGRDPRIGKALFSEFGLPSEKLEAQLLENAKNNQIPIQYILFLPINDKKWGQRLIALLRWDEKVNKHEHKKKLIQR